MSIQSNPNIIKITGTIQEYNGRTFMGRNGADNIDDIWHYAYLIIEDEKGELLKFERVTTNEKIEPEIEVGNSCTLYFRRIRSWKKSVFHLIASESDTRGLNCFTLYQTVNRIAHVLMMMKAVPGAYILGLFMFVLPASATIGIGNVFWLALIPPIAFLVLNHLDGPGRVRKDSIALHKELERSRVGAKFGGRQLKTV
ncbi:hypothetical protein [Rhizobium sp. NXC24]|uniref:hypothetical protein n=1 Tax=Rhizobium sp. NXC24 TaxID=2048897 RepID=UPI000CDF3A42|nr:hypothetical protein [Rhizobium sp. NXC24]AVA21964.1 hypothetical protein NXC24_CH02327 [Rhizobium sp. NXC24]